MMTEKLGRVLTAMITPMHDDGTINYPAARSLAHQLVQSGSDGVVVVGTTGESPTLTKNEEQLLFREIKDELGDQYTVVAGTGSNNTAEALKATLEAEEAGVDAALLVVPYYNKPTQEGLYQHFKTIAQASRLPLILYNVPARTVVSLSADTVARLAAVPNIVGIKEASGNLELCRDILNKVPADFKIWSGDDASNYAVLKMGGYGVVSVTAHLVGRQIQTMVQHVLAGHWEQAEHIQISLSEINKALFVTANPQPIKYALNCLGFAAGKPRLPLVEPNDIEAEVIRTALKNIKLDLAF